MVNLGGWRLTWFAHDNEERPYGAQLVPINDIREHEENPGCWCKPTRMEEFDDSLSGGYWTHNSADGREAFEDGKAKPS